MLHDKKLHSLYIQGNYIYNIKIGEHLARMEEARSAFKILTGKSTRMRSPGRLRVRSEGNIRMNFKEIGVNSRSWIDSAQDRGYWRALVNAVLNLLVSKAMAHLKRKTQMNDTVEPLPITSTNTLQELCLCVCSHK